MPLHVEYRSGVARGEICRCRGNHVGGVESEHEALRDLAVYERSDLRNNLLYKLLLRPAVGLSLAPYRQHEVAFEQCRVFRERLRPSVPLHVDELVREVLVGAFLVGISPYRMAIRRRGLHRHLAVKQCGECHVRIEVCDCAHSITPPTYADTSPIGFNPAIMSLIAASLIVEKKFRPRSSSLGEPCMSIR